MNSEQQFLWGRWPKKEAKEDRTINAVEASETIDKTKTAIIDLIIKCSKEATKESSQNKFTEFLDELVTKLKEIFKSEYCAIGTVDEKYVIDRACTQKLSKDLNWAPIDSQSILVCKALGYEYKNNNRQFINYYDRNELEKSGNYEKYKEKLNIDPENSTVIIIQDEDGDPQGYLQFINSESEINTKDYEPYKDDILRLAFVVKQWYVLSDERLFLKDFDCINQLSKNTNDVNNLLFGIMDYLSKNFNAGIISYRIPLLVGTERAEVFFLRDCYVTDEIMNNKEIKERYFKTRLVVKKGKMGGVQDLICENHGLPAIITEPTDSVDELGVSQDYIFKTNVVLIPIIRDHSEKCKCTKINNEICQKCKDRFEKYYGIFKLRILKKEDDEEDDSIPEEVIKRLHNLARHISVLLNAIVDKDENESLNTFQTGLNDSSFTDFTSIKDFDSQCAKTIKSSTGAKACAIYKYDKLSDEMVLSAAAPQIDQIDIEGDMNTPNFGQNIKKTINNCKKWGFDIEEDIVDRLFERNEPLYYVTEDNIPNNSIILVPMKKKDNTRIGMILLIGKNARNGSLSKTYWEQDKKYIKFMVDILSRIEESDADRLVFLLRLSHELRKPITQMVYKNDFLFSTAERNRDSISKKELIDGLDYNMYSCMLFKQIIGDIESTYYLRKGKVSYTFKEEKIKQCLLDIIRLFEHGGGTSSDKGLTFMTHLSKMPQTMYVDKERIKQVFVNLLKNAIQYSDDYSTITVSYSFNDGDNCHEIDFRNYGIGIEEKDKEDIFKLWKRSEAAQKKRPNGTGMGLSIVKEIMNAHGGNCYVKRLNNPTIFTVSIPQKH